MSKTDKKKRKKPWPRTRKTRRKAFELAKNVNSNREKVRTDRIEKASKQLTSMRNGIRTSEDLLSSLVNDQSNKAFIVELHRDLRRMKGRAAKFELALESAISSTDRKRLPRKRFKSDKVNERYISKIKSKRRRKRTNTENNEKESANKEYDNDIDASVTDSDSSVDSEADDATYVPQTFIFTKQRRKRKSVRTKGLKEGSVIDKEDVFTEEYECLNAKYQFALDLRAMDVAPGKFFPLQTVLKF